MKVVLWHVLAIPMYECHTGKRIFNTAGNAFDALCNNWRNKIIGTLINGDRKMTSRISGVATRFQQIAKHGFDRVCCGAHQLDIVLQTAYIAFGNEQLYKSLTGPISYLRRPRGLGSRLQSRTPTVRTTHRKEMRRVSNWFKKH